MGSLSGDRIFLLALGVGYPVVAVGLYLNGYQVRWFSAIVVPLVVYLRWPKKQQQEPTARELDQWSSEDEAQFKRLLNQRRQ